MASSHGTDRISARRDLGNDPGLVLIAPCPPPSSTGEHFQPADWLGDSTMFSVHSKPNGQNQTADSQIRTSSGRWARHTAYVEATNGTARKSARLAEKAGSFWESFTAFELFDLASRTRKSRGGLQLCSSIQRSLRLKARSSSPHRDAYPLQPCDLLRLRSLIMWHPRRIAALLSRSASKGGFQLPEWPITRRMACVMNTPK
jgi:hypothetical protein